MLNKFYDDNAPAAAPTPLAQFQAAPSVELVKALPPDVKAQVLAQLPSTPANLANLLKELIALEPDAVLIMNELGPFTANLPLPWNLLNNPLIQQALAAFPTLLPILQKLEQILEQIAAQQPPVPPNA